jgi:hypothetical protein
MDINFLQFTLSIDMSELMSFQYGDRFLLHLCSSGLDWRGGGRSGDLHGDLFCSVDSRHTVVSIKCEYHDKEGS